MPVRIIVLHVVVILTTGIFTHPSLAQTPSMIASEVTVEPYRATNVRSGPSVTFEVIGELQQGQIVEATGRSDDFSNWLQVNLGSRRGWVAFFTVSVNGEVDTLPIIEVLTPTPAPTETSTVNFQPASSEIYVTAYRRVNVRNGPGTDFAVLGALVPGQTADVIGTSGEANEWIQINFNGQPGWLAYFVVTVSGEITDLESGSAIVRSPNSTLPTTANDEGVLNQVIVITRFNTNLRSEPVLGADVIDIVPFETTLQALTRTSDSRWLRVRHNNETGWLISSLVNTGIANINALPIDESGATE